MKIFIRWISCISAKTSQIRRLTNSQYGVSMLSTYAVSMKKITIRRYSKSSKLGMISMIYYERSVHSKESSPIRPPHNCLCVLDMRPSFKTGYYILYNGRTQPSYEEIHQIEGKAKGCGRSFNWQTATYGKVKYYEDEDDCFTDFESEFPAIVFNDTSDAALSYEPTVSPLNDNKINFRISFDESDDEDYTINSDVQDFVRVGYENKWFVDLYVEHFDYDVMDFINKEANEVLSGGSSDEYYSSIEIEEFDEVDFHTKREENVVIKNLTTHDPFLNKLCGNNGMFRDYLDESVPEIEGEALDDPDDAHIDPIHKA
ncbi:hypothetical protein Tco_1438041 [Tanacetum coccineum]